MAPSSTASTKANPDTSLQEVEFKLAGEVFRVRPTYRIIARLEQVLDAPARELGLRCIAAQMNYSQRNGVKEISFSEIVTMLGAVLADNPKAPRPADIGDILMEKGGYLDLAAPFGILLTRHLQGNEEYEREMREKAREEGADVKPDENPPTTEPVVQQAAE